MSVEKWNIGDRKQVAYWTISSLSWMIFAFLGSASENNDDDDRWHCYLETSGMAASGRATAANLDANDL